MYLSPTLSILLLVVAIAVFIVAANRNSKFGVLIAGVIFIAVMVNHFVYLAHMDSIKIDRENRTTSVVGVVNKAGRNWERADGTCVQIFALYGTPCIFEESCNAFSNDKGISDFFPLHLGEMVDITYMRPKKADDRKCELLNFRNWTREEDRVRSALPPTPEEPLPSAE